MAIARLAGITLPANKRIEISLMYIYGVGRSLAGKILEATKINPDTRTNALSEDEINRIREELKLYRVEGDLRREVLMNVKRLKEIGSHRGSRHQKRLPVRGQRTKTNSRTVRGNTRRTMGSGRKTSAQKT